MWVGQEKKQAPPGKRTLREPSCRSQSSQSKQNKQSSCRLAYASSRPQPGTRDARRTNEQTNAHDAHAAHDVRRQAYPLEINRRNLVCIFGDVRSLPVSPLRGPLHSSSSSCTALTLAHIPPPDGPRSGELCLSLMSTKSHSARRL